MRNDINYIIVNSKDVLGGCLRIGGTRISVRTIAILYKSGYSPEEIADQFEQLKLAQVFATLVYYHANQAEIESDIEKEEAEYDKLEKKLLQVQKSA